MPQFLKTDEIRRRWIEFFVQHGHKPVASDSLVPQNDPSVLFTGAGMNQFKENFMGRAKLDHPQQRAVTVQKCIRTGDIDNVGRTPNHHTFFEMLGNFSFGDYFKKEAVEWAWQFCTDPVRGLGLEKDRLSVTIFGGDPKLGIEKDTEAQKWWQTYAPELKNADGSWRIYEYGEHDNFWPADAPSLGPNGPCGPCSEIYYDTKPEQGTPEPVANSKDSTRYVEIWNLVFTQFNRLEGGKLEPLSQKNIDTGAGLERMARVMQGKSTNFETDHLFPIVQEVARIAGKTYEAKSEDGRRMRRITDHTRAGVFCIADGVTPKNEGRNYVVRRLLRRALLDGRELGITEPFLGKVARVVIQCMHAGYPELTPRADTLVRHIEEEERSFDRTLAQGREILDLQLQSLTYEVLQRDRKHPISGVLPLAARYLHEGLRVVELPDGMLGFTAGSHLLVPGSNIAEETCQDQRMIDDANSEWAANKSKLSAIPHSELALRGRIAFRLWDTFGFPLELTTELAEGLGLSVDRAGFEKELAEAQKRSQAGSAMAKEIFAGGPVAELKKRFAGWQTAFKGYETLSVKAKVLAIIQGEALVEAAQPGGDAVVLLDQTPFYGESGGQVGDKGELAQADSLRHEVLDAQKQEGLVLHRVKLAGALKVGESVEATVDPKLRLPTLKNHSASHLLQSALREILGKHVEQRGSLVGPNRLRFDFTHFEQPSAEQLAAIEARVNEMVVADFPVDVQELSIAEAKAKGAMALFGEKYGERVRVVSMGPSMELCGGTHCQRTGQIGYFRIVSESAIAAGVRRIEALTGLNAVADARKSEELLAKLASMLKTHKGGVVERVESLQEEAANLGRELEAQKKKAASAAAGELLSGVKEVSGIKLLATQVPDADASALRTMLDGIRKQFKEGAVVLGGSKDGKVALLVSFTPDVVKRGGHAGNLLKELAPKVGGKGGGKPEMAQGGGTQAEKLPEALGSVGEMLGKMVK
ncbi:MAG TPA: alanine--tRNA ligase [Planctomycetota bacterium]|jgi:alanyl-tRNA synthetase